jgi:hypothetical protein
MKANELRIGNYALAFNEHIWEIDGIRKSSVFFGSSNCPYSELSPIPITEEWLLRFGFFRKERRQGLHLGYTTIWVGTNGRGKYFLYKRFGRTARTVETVHHLQNIHFALTGEELQTKE